MTINLSILRKLCYLTYDAGQGCIDQCRPLRRKHRMINGIPERGGNAWRLQLDVDQRGDPLQIAMQGAVEPFPVHIRQPFGQHHHARHRRRQGGDAFRAQHAVAADAVLHQDGLRHLLQRVFGCRAMARQQPLGQRAQGWAPGNADKVKISKPVSVTASECSNWADSERSLVTVVHLSGNTFTW